MLVGSIGFYPCFDRLNTCEGDHVPLLLISCLQVSEHPGEVSAREIHRRVDLKIEFLIAEAKNHCQVV